jgi:hypothetical protein
MNTDVLLLVLNAFLSMLLGAILIFRILWREYRPTLKRLESEEASGRNVDSSP